ncbi:MAG: YiiX/YebB-like N1pC/P60 family cysteine hydrolase [Steroidobacteraceae bacterium]
MSGALTWLGRRLADFLSQERPRGEQVGLVDPAVLAATLRPCDVLLVEGNTRISVAIKYLTQSTWSHAALYVGSALGAASDGGEARVFIEADVREGVRAVALSKYAFVHTRICRPIGLTAEDAAKVIAYAAGRIGHRYDLKNVIDLARFLLPTPPVPARLRRRMIAFGSGDPTRAICSTLIAQAFQAVRFPILPEVSHVKTGDPACDDCYKDIFRIRHHSLFAPRDFDVSPYFDVVKPTIEAGFDYRTLRWAAPNPPLESS